MSYQFSINSKKELSTCHADLQLILQEALKVSAVDFGVAEGHRIIARQKELYEQNKSQIDGVTNKGKHNYNPSLAADLYAYVEGEANWSERYLCYLAGLITAIAEWLRKEGCITHTIRWGGNWDSDGIFISDQKLRDLPHFEIVE